MSSIREEYGLNIFADGLIEKFSFIPEHHQRFFEQTEKEEVNFLKLAGKKYIKEKKGGFKFTLHTTADKLKREKIFAVLSGFE